MIDCKFSFSFGENEFHSDIDIDTDVYVDSKPEKDEEGNWKPILMSFKPDENSSIWNVFSIFYNFDCSNNSTPKYGSAILCIDGGDAYVLYDVWPKSLKFDNESNSEVVWQFNGVTLLESKI